MEDFYTREDKSKELIILKVKLPADAFTQSYKALLAEELKKTDMKGFRKGKFPADVLEQQIKPALLIETFQRVAPYYVNAAIMKEKIEPAAAPDYKDLGELETGKPIEFTVEVTVMPTFKLANLKKIKPDTKPESATKEDIQKTLDNMFESNKEKIKEDKMDDKWALAIAKEYKFDDDVKDLETLKKKVTEIIDAQKAAYIRQAQESEVIRKAVKESKITIPEAAMHYEAHEREHAFQHELEAVKMTAEDFCKQRDITMEQLREQWHKDAQEALENDVLFKTYANERGIEVDEKQFEEELNKIKMANIQKTPYDSKIYQDAAWLESAKSYIKKQKAFRAIVDEILGEFKPVNPEKSKK